jgi:hypothetical protein
MEAFIKTLKSVSLSGQDILDAINNKANLISYDKLKKVKDIDEILKDGACVILYLSEEQYGHWTCVFKRQDKNNLIEFFDPYGVSVDLEKKWVPKNKRINLGVDHNYLSRLLANSNYDVEFNHYKFQDNDKSVAVCGRWVIMRLLFRHLSLNSFNKLFGKSVKMNPDDIVTLMTTVFIYN